MAFLNAPIPDRQRLIQRPIYFRTVGTVLRHLGLIDKFKVMWVNDNGEVTNPNTLVDKQDKEFVFVTDVTNTVYVEVSEDPNTDLQLTHRVFTRNHPPVWYDSKYGLSITPQYHNYEAKVSLRFQLRSRTQAERMYSVLKRKLALTNQFNVFAEYRLPLADEALYVINEYYLRVKQIEQSELTLYQYLKQHAGRTLTELFRLDGVMDNFCFIETQHGILAQHETVMAPELQRDGEGVWSVSLDLKLHYQCPVDYSIEYNELVGRLRLPDILVKNVAEPVYEHFLDYSDTTWHNFAAIKHDSPYINLPNWDNFRPPVSEGLHPFITILTVPQKDTGQLLDLNDDLSGYYFHDNVKAYLTYWREDIHDHHKHPLSIQVYQGNVPLHPSLWSLSEDGQLVLLQDDEPNVVLRVVIIGNLNWAKLNSNALQEVAQQGELLKGILPVFLPHDESLIPDVTPGKPLFQDQLIGVSKAVNRRYGQLGLNPAALSVRVGTFHILIARQNQ